MVEFSFPKLGTILGSFFSIVTVTNGTFLGNFLKWVTFQKLNWLFQFIIDYYPALMTTSLVVVAYGKFKDVRVLGVIWILIFLLIYYGLRTMGSVNIV